MLLNNGQKSVSAEYYDVTMKVAFDPLDIKCHGFIFLIILGGRTTLNHNPSSHSCRRRGDIKIIPAPLQLTNQQAKLAKLILPTADCTFIIYYKTRE